MFGQKNVGNDVLDYLLDAAPLRIDAGYLPVPAGAGLGAAASL